MVGETIEITLSSAYGRRWKHVCTTHTPLPHLHCLVTHQHSHRPAGPQGKCLQICSRKRTVCLSVTSSCRTNHHRKSYPQPSQLFFFWIVCEESKCCTSKSSPFCSTVIGNQGCTTNPHVQGSASSDELNFEMGIQGMYDPLLRTVRIV